MNIYIKFDPAKSTKRKVKESAGIVLDKNEYTTEQKISIALGKMKTYTTYDFFTGEIGYWTYVFGVPTKICKTPEELRNELERTYLGMESEENSRLSARWTISGQTGSMTTEKANTANKIHIQRRLFEN